MQSAPDTVSSLDLIDPISIYDYIQLKSKIKFIDSHPHLPWIAFSDEEQNIMMFDLIQKKPIRTFNINVMLSNTLIIKELKFWNTNEKKFIQNYDFDSKKVKGINFNFRSALLIITTDKLITFYNYITNNVYKTITTNELEQKVPVKAEIFNYMYLIIQTLDGSLLIWHLTEWVIVRTLNKANFNKPLSSFMVISTAAEESFIICTNVSGNLFLIDISKKDVHVNKLEGDKVRIFSNLRTNMML